MPELKVCEIGEVLPGELKQFNIDKKELLVINLKGKMLCLDARCTHAGAPLEEGELIDSTLICPWHGSRFNVNTGEVLKGPAQKPLRVYRTKIREDTLVVEM
jgi:nitrite reductase/ring-hydroxylating ferredoxin subunit